MADDDTKLEMELALDELELLGTTEALLNRLFEDAELDTRAGEELALVVTAELAMLDGLTTIEELVTLDELNAPEEVVTLDELDTTEELITLDELIELDITEELVAGGISLGRFAGVEDVAPLGVDVSVPAPPPPPPHALNTKTANSSERDCIFILKVH